MERSAGETLVRNFSAEKDARQGLDLYPRELEVLKLTAKGLRNKEIARELTISERTVQAHLSNIFSKLEVDSRTEAVLKALKAGWLDYQTSVRAASTEHSVLASRRLTCQTGPLVRPAPISDPKRTGQSIPPTEASAFRNRRPHAYCEPAPTPPRTDFSSGSVRSSKRNSCRWRNNGPTTHDALCQMPGMRFTQHHFGFLL